MGGHVMTKLRERFGDDLSPRARAVLDALGDARESSTTFLLSCGILPEVSESCTEGMHAHVHALSERHFERREALDELRASLARRGLDAHAIEDVEHLLTALLTADTTAAYLLGLAAGLGLGSLDRRLAE
jgi:hypothetical protein